MNETITVVHHKTKTIKYSLQTETGLGVWKGVSGLTTIDKIKLKLKYTVVISNFKHDFKFQTWF